MQVAEEEAGGIADAAVGICGALEDLLGEGHFVAVVGGGNPQTQDVGAQCLDDVLGFDSITQ